MLPVTILRLRPYIYYLYEFFEFLPYLCATTKSITMVQNKSNKLYFLKYCFIKRICNIVWNSALSESLYEKD